MASVVDQRELSQRLSRISTNWGVVWDAHHGSGDEAVAARRELVLEYGGVVYRYLLGAVRDPDVAEELAHEFAVRVMRGDLRRADPERGRFRDYVKRVLINLVNDHVQSRMRRPVQPPSAWEPVAPLPSSDSQASFEDCLRDDLIERTWRALEQSNSSYHAVLLKHVENPDFTSCEIAESLSVALESPLTPSGVRKTLERARRAFADLLVEEVAKTLEDSSPDRLRDELKELDLLKYCRGAVERHKFPPSCGEG